MKLAEYVGFTGVRDYHTHEREYYERKTGSQGNYNRFLMILKAIIQNIPDTYICGIGIPWSIQNVGKKLLIFHCKKVKKCLTLICSVLY